MKNIVVPVDFSAVSENAANYAAGLAAFYGARLWLYHAYLLPGALPEYGYPLPSGAELENAAGFEMEELVKRIQSKQAKQITIDTKIELEHLHKGLPVLCEESSADLVVMGLTGKSALTRLVVGSNTVKAIHYLKYPVLVVPKDSEFNPIHRVGFACDYKKVNETTPVETIRQIVSEFNAQLHVINVDWHNRNFKPETPGEQFYLHMYLHGLDVQYHNIESEDLSSGLNAFAKAEDIDLLITIPKKHNLVEKLFGSSKVEDLIYHTNLPVMCMHEVD